MKFVLAALMMSSLLGVFGLAMLAMSYVYVGYGLHPAIAGVAGAFLLAAGYYGSTLLD